MYSCEPDEYHPNYEPLPPEAFRPLKPGPGYISPLEREQRLLELQKRKPKKLNKPSAKKKIIYSSFNPPLPFSEEQWINERIRLYKKWQNQVGDIKHCPRCTKKLEFGFSVRCRWALAGVKLGRWICIHCHLNSGKFVGPPSGRRKEFLAEHPFCHYCDRYVDAATSSLDHVHPRVHGGVTDSDNVVLACLLCNNEKGSLSASQYIDLRAKLYERLNLLL